MPSVVRDRATGAQHRKQSRASPRTPTMANGGKLGKLKWKCVNIGSTHESRVNDSARIVKAAEGSRSRLAPLSTLHDAGPKG